MKVAIVGAEDSKWKSDAQRKLAKDAIRSLITVYKFAGEDYVVITGMSDIDGVKVWVEEIAKEMEIKVESYVADVNKFSDEGDKKGYASIISKIANEADVVIDIDPKGIKSIGNRILRAAKKLGKDAEFVEIKEI